MIFIRISEAPSLLHLDLTLHSASNARNLYTACMRRHCAFDWSCYYGYFRNRIREL